MSLTALYTGTTGLDASSNALDTVGNDLANLETTGYKSQTTTFSDMVYQTLSGGSGPSGTTGGTNPQQVGSGVEVAATQNDFTQGTITPTGQPLDAAISGNGFFEVSNGVSTSYTRAGAFTVNGNGYLIDPNTGDFVQRYGSVGEGTSTVPGFQTAGNNNISIPYGTGLPGTKTANVTYQGNLDASATVGDSDATQTTSIQIYDSQSTAHTLNVTFTKTAANTWSVSATTDDSGTVSLASDTVTFDPTTGELKTPTTGIVATVTYPGNTAQTINLNLGTAGDANGLTQFGGTSSATALNQDGTGFGTLTSVSIDQDGIIQGSFSNGGTAEIAQLAIAGFDNENGLEREGSNYYQATASSGQALVGTAGQGSNGTITGGALEGSNTDIATEFSQLIIAENAFQVNTQTITAENNTLQELASIIH